MENNTNRTTSNIENNKKTYVLEGLALGYLISLLITTLLGSTIGIDWIFGTVKSFGTMLELSAKYFAIYGMCLGGIIGLALNPMKNMKIFIIGMLTCPAALIIPLSHIDLSSLLREINLDADGGAVVILISYIIISLIGIFSLASVMKSNNVSNNTSDSICLAYFAIATVFAIAMYLGFERIIDMDFVPYYYLSFLVSTLIGIVFYSLRKDPNISTYKEEK